MGTARPVHGRPIVALPPGSGARRARSRERRGSVLDDRAFVSDDDLREGAARRHHHRRPAAERLQRRETEGLEGAGCDHDVGGGKGLRDARTVGLEAEEVDWQIGRVAL